MGTNEGNAPVAWDRQSLSKKVNDEFEATGKYWSALRGLHEPRSTALLYEVRGYLVTLRDLVQVYPYVADGAEPTDDQRAKMAEMDPVANRIIANYQTALEELDMVYHAYQAQAARSS